MEQGKMVIHFNDGRLIKGHSRDFFPNKPVFHVETDPAEPAAEVAVKDLKAIFFVKEFDGNPEYQEKKEFMEGQKVHARKARITFKDGETTLGTVQSYDAQRPGFFLVPADPKSNNIRIFIISSAIQEITFP